MNNLTPSDKSTLDNYNGMTVGSIFRKTRETKGYDLLQIAAHLNIGSEHLEAIEKDDYAVLPQKVYAVGFVRAYADLLELNAEKMAYLFKVQAYGKKQTEDQKAMIITDGKTVGLRDAIISNKGFIPVILVVLVAFGLAVATIIFLGMWIFSEKSDDRFVVPEVPVALLEGGGNHQTDFIAVEDNAQSPQEPMSIIIKPNDGAMAYGVDALQSALTFKMQSNASLEIRSVDNGQVLISKQLNTGDVFYTSENQDILLSTDNAGAIEAFLDNQSLGLLGAEKAAIRLRPFSVKALRLQRAN